MDLVSLRLFVDVAETGSIAAAAARGHRVASAVSKRLSQLEATLEVQLYKRHAKGVALTAAGELLLARARDILRGVDATVREVGGARDHGPHLRLSANHSAMVQFLPDDLASWLAKRPAAGIDLVERLSADAVRAVVDGHADVAIFCWPTLPAGLRSWPYRSDELVVAAPVEHPLVRGAPRRRRQGGGGVASAVPAVPFEALADEPFIAYWPNLSVATAMPSLLERTRARIRLHVANFEATCRMVEAGLGLAILPLANVEARARQGRVACLRLTDAWARRQLTIAIRDDVEPRPGVLPFIDHLVACAAGIAGSDANRSGFSLAEPIGPKEQSPSTGRQSPRRG